MAQRYQAGHALKQIQAHRKNRHEHHARDHFRVKVGFGKQKGAQRCQSQSHRILGPYT